MVRIKKIFIFYAKVYFVATEIWRNPEKRGFCDPRGGGNVLRGLSNKCLMRGTFPAILFFVFFRVFCEENLRFTSSDCYECIAKQNLKNTLIFVFFWKTRFAVFAKKRVFSCFPGNREKHRFSRTFPENQDFYVFL